MKYKNEYIPVEYINGLNLIENYGSVDEGLLIYGENYSVLKKINNWFKEQMACIYLDPPYNTRNEFEHFNDCLSHEEWLEMMKKRLELLWDFLREDGSIWISIDDDECHYLKILCDQLWGRDKYLTMIVRQKNESPSNYERRKIVHMHDYVLVYCKNKEKCILNTIPIQYIEEYFEEDNIGRKWIAKSILTPYNELDNGKYSYEIVTPSGRKLIPPYGRQWSVEADEFERLRNNNKIWFGISGDEYPNLKRFVDEMDLTQAVSLWSKKMVGSNQEARHEVSNYNDKEFFYVAKPERFIQLILTIATNEGDWVLDPFLGSGTTAAVSMKLKRKWIGIEKGKQCEEFCLPRLKSVMIGDNVGISENVGWRGGGGFYFCQDCAED